MAKITNIKHKLYMHPMRKYEVYGKFPWKLIIQILIVISTTSQILLIVNKSTTYSYNQYILWNKIFLNKDADGSDTTITNSYNIFGAGQLKKIIADKVGIYYDVNSHTIDNYEFNYEDDGTKKPPKLLVEYYDNELALSKGYDLQYKLYTNDIGPFSDGSVHDFMDHVKIFEVSFMLRHKLNSHIDLASKCYEWDLKIKYDFTYHGVVESKLETNIKDCSRENQRFLKNFFWIDLSVLILGVVSLIGIGQYIQGRLELVSSIIDSHSGYYRAIRQAWEHLGINEKLQFFNFWIIINILGNIFQIFSGILSILNSRTTLNVYEKVAGFGCFFAWIGILRFLDHRSHSYTIIITVSRCFKEIGMYIIGIIPIFMGYGFLAQCSFWKTGIYPSTPLTCLANYAAVNGDSVYAWSIATFQESSFFAQLYYYSFVVFFICCVHNLFIAIIERSFSSIAEDPPKFGDESDDEEEEKEIEENKKQSKQALRKVLSVGRRKSRKILFDENTLKTIQNINGIMDEYIIKDLNQLSSILDKYQGSPDYEVIKERLINIIDFRIKPILEHFS